MQALERLHVVFLRVIKKPNQWKGFGFTNTLKAESNHAKFSGLNGYMIIKSPARCKAFNKDALR